MAGYVGTKAVLLSTTAANVGGDADIGGALDVGGAFTSQGIDDNATSTAMTLDGSGNVGIGTSSPQGKMQLKGDSNADVFYLTDANEDDRGLMFSNSSNGIIWDIDAKGASGSFGQISFSTNSSEAMRIDASGNLLVGKTSTANLLTTAGHVFYGNGEAFITRAGTPLYLGRTGSNGSIANFYKDGTSVGSISVTGSSTSYNTSSDYRLKTDAQPMTGASARVQALNPVNFEWIADGTRVDGFLAHEAQAVVPEAITGAKDAMRDEEYEVTPAVTDDDGNVVTEAVMGTRSVPDYQGIDQSKLVPLLTAALQEALTEITDLKARVAALEAN